MRPRSVLAWLALAAAVSAHRHVALPDRPARRTSGPHSPRPAPARRLSRRPERPRPKLGRPLARDLDDSDEIAALDAIRVALSEVGDGASFVWHRSNGRLSGVVQPTASFKDAAGRVCRHIVLVLTTGLRTGRAEGRRLPPR